MSRWILILIVLALVGAIVGIGAAGAGSIEAVFYVFLGSALFLFLGDVLVGPDRSLRVPDGQSIVTHAQGTGAKAHK